jgi:hypothetical protein
MFIACSFVCRSASALVPQLARRVRPVALSKPCRLLKGNYPVRLFFSKDSSLENDFDATTITTVDINEDVLYFDSSSHDDDDDSNEDVHDEDDDDPQLNPMIQVHLAWSKAVQTTVEQLAKKTNSLKRELEKTKTMDQTVARAQLIVSNLYLFKQVNTAKVQDWDQDGQEVELTLDPQYDSAATEADALFTQARKLKRGTAVVQELLDKTENAVRILKESQAELESVLVDDETLEEERFRLVQLKLERTAKQTQFQLPTPPTEQQMSPKPRTWPPKKSVLETSVRKLKSPGGSIVLVGRNRRGNDYLSTQVAKGKDVWMHARGCPGAHVILQSRPGSPKITQDCLDFCANVAAFYSDFRTETRVDVTAADPKHVLKPRGAPLGAVKLREELYTITGYPDAVPEELKVAREESGQTDEFRAKDKQKHRQRTAEVVKQEQSKKRAEHKAKRKRGGQTAKKNGDALPDFF